MALIDVVKIEMNDYELCKKFPSEDLRIGTQLVVYPTQIAFFVKGGVVCDEFTAGTYTLTTENIPILNKIVNLPFGGDSPFQAEVWFINLTTKLDMKWGTPSPIQLEDPKYEIIIPVRAYGTYGIRVLHPKSLLQMFIGNMRSFSAEKVHEYFKGQMLAHLNNAISSKMTEAKISILEINAHLLDMSLSCQGVINRVFEKYGMELVDFTFVSINIPQDDPSVIKLKEAKATAAGFKVTGRDLYQMERSFDVLQTAAGNEGNGGAMMAMGAGLGVGTAMGQVAASNLNVSSHTPPPIPNEQKYFVYINGQQYGDQTIQSIRNLVSQGLFTQDTLVWKSGLENWVKASDLPELAQLFMRQVPPPIAPQI